MNISRVSNDFNQTQSFVSLVKKKENIVVALAVIAISFVCFVIAYYAVNFLCNRRVSVNSAPKPIDEGHLRDIRNRKNLVGQARRGEFSPSLDLGPIVQAICTAASRIKGPPHALMIAESGTGRTTIQQALAQTISDGMIDDRFKNYRVFSFDLGELGSASFEDTFIQNCDKLFNDMRSAGEAFVFFTDIGQEADINVPDPYHMDIDRKKNRIARFLTQLKIFFPAGSEISWIGICSSNILEKILKRDPAVFLDFTKIEHQAPSEARVFDIITECHQAELENRYQVTVCPEAIRKIIEHSDLRDGNQPVKAIQLLEHVMQRAKPGSKITSEVAEAILQSREPVGTVVDLT